MENSKANSILAQEKERVESMKTGVADLMRSAGQGAIVWGANVFGSTSYPEMADPSGRNHQVCGLVLDSEGVLQALVSYPGGTGITGVKTLTPAQAAEFITPDMMLQGASPEEWSVLCDCYQVAAQVLKAQADRDAPQPWW